MTTTLFAQITDLHIREPGRLAYGRINTAPYLENAVAAINALPQQVEAVVITGDLTDFGRDAEYAHLHELLAPLKAPIYMIPGNHDERNRLRACFPSHTYLDGDSRFAQFVVPVGPLRLIALDTGEIGLSSGRLCKERLAWLEKALADNAEHPVVIAMHHPPFDTLIGHMDKIGLLEGAPELEALVRQHPNVERIICGHLHRAIDTRFGGTIASTCPAPAHQVCLDLAPDAESAWCLEPPAYRLHAWDPGANRLVSHLAMVGPYEGPYPFHDMGKLID
ncbi:phosphodiesterase [Paenalcaligenes niemegkensis]|uniref:phosphodiesterase n=1 Tax=Paenalcaligenes niemegkensis TaxID=2895469 RepID=UPI001EE99CC4|nr:phosphodiesterase [Paenalcaligenes niemegkensis]MCQ9616163.1 phosphodiesterase [Paenalcaligenes niemegkensis]